VLDTVIYTSVLLTVSIVSLILVSFYIFVYAKILINN